MSNLDDLMHSHGGISLAHIYDPAEYNPQQAHAYYEAHKKLKGRQHTLKQVPTGRHRHSRAPVVLKKHVGKKLPAKSAQQRRTEAEAKVKSLQGKLARLSQILAKLVKEAKARSGVVDDPAKAKAKTKADPSTSNKPPSKLTPQQRKDAAKRAKEYRDTHAPSPEEQAAVLEQKIADVSQKIKDLRAQAAEAHAADQRAAAAKAKPAAAAKRTSSSVGARAKPN